MNKLSIAFAALAFALGTAGCSTTDTSRGNVPHGADISSIKAKRGGGSEHSELLSVMTGSEREAYHRHDNDADRRRYLLANGITTRLEMQRRLSKGMSKAEVLEQMKGLYETLEHAPDHADRLYFSKFNSRSNTHMYCIFNRTINENDDLEFSLMNWGSYTDEQIEQGRDLAFLEADLKRKLDRWLRVGMGESEIDKTKADIAKMRNALIENSDTTISGDASSAGSKAFESDRAPLVGIGTDIWRLNAMVEFYDDLTSDPEYVINQGKFTYWYHKIEVAGADRFIVVEYRFENSILKSWWVYNKDFLGFDE